MATSAVSGATATTPTATDRGVSSMKSEDFFKILVTELQQQDPLQPNKTSDMIGEVSQIRSIELSKQLTDSLSLMSKQQRTTGSSEMLGKYITAKVTDQNGADREVSGVVTGVRFDSDGSAVLELDTGESIPATSVTRITTADAAKSKAAATTSAKTKAATTTPAATSTDKTGQTAQPRSGGLLPFLSLDAGIHV